MLARHSGRGRLHRRHGAATRLGLRRYRRPAPRVEGDRQPQPGTRVRGHTTARKEFGEWVSKVDRDIFFIL
jgi:hypothetical protein